MTIRDAKRIVREFDDATRKPTDEELFLFTDAMDFLIQEEQNPRDMMYLGGVYYEMKRFDLALKYYEMAAAMDYDEAYECLGYIWYYGRTGKRDFRKAFEYFSKMMAKGHLVATYKVADMYKNGYYVEKNPARYRAIIEDLYPRVQSCTNLFDPYPEVATRLARIRMEEGRNEEAVKLLLSAKEVLAERIEYNAFFGNLNIMKWLIDDLYTLIPFDEKEFDLFDLYYLLKTPHTIAFEYEGKRYTVESVMEGPECSICYNGKWFRTRDDFFAGALIEDTNEKLTAYQEALYGFEVIL